MKPLEAKRLYERAWRRVDDLQAAACSRRLTGLDEIRRAKERLERVGRVRDRAYAVWREWT